MFTSYAIFKEVDIERLSVYVSSLPWVLSRLMEDKFVQVTALKLLITCILFQP